ncbi:hypothetical protein [Bartonella tribocorum]|nr:hypothetical protein [Bartonella tribocorum]
MRNFHDLKNSALDAYKSCKPELKGNGEVRVWFPSLRLYVLPK